VAGKENSGNDADGKQRHDERALTNHATGQANEAVGRALEITIERTKKSPHGSAALAGKGRWPKQQPSKRRA